MTIRKPFAVLPLPLLGIASGNERSNRPASHLSLPQHPGIRWESSGASNLWVRGQFSGNQPVDFVSLMASNALAGTTIRVRLGTTQAQVDGTAPYDSTALPLISPARVEPSGLYHSHLELPSVANASWWRIDIGGHTGDFSASCLIFGQKREPSNFYNRDREVGFEDLGALEITRNGVVADARGCVLSTLLFRLGWVDEAEWWEKWAPMGLRDTQGSKRIIFWSFDPEPTIYRQRKTLIGYMARDLFKRGNEQGTRNTMDVQFRGLAFPPLPLELRELGLDQSELQVGTPASVNIIGATAGSTITGTVPAGLSLDSAARTITGTPTVAGNNTLELTETMAGISNSPRVSSVALNVLFTPSLLFANGEKGGWWDMSDLSTMWADTAGTVPASVDGSVRRIDDKSGNGNHLIVPNAAHAPILRTDAGLFFLEFDGTDDGMVRAGFDFGGSDRVSAWIGLRTSLVRPTEHWFGLGNTASQDGSFEAFQSSGGVQFRSRGTTRVIAAGAGNATANVPLVFAANAEISPPSITVFNNSTASTPNTTNQGTGTYTQTDFTLGKLVSGSAFPANIFVSQLIVRNVLTTGDLFNDVRSFVAEKAGVTL